MTSTKSAVKTPPTPHKDSGEMETLAKELVGCYRKEAELYQSVLKLTELQHDSLDSSGEVRDFITLLHQKEDLIRAIDKVEVQLERAKARWLQVSEGDRASNQELNEILDGIIMTIEKVMMIEQQNEVLLRARKDDIEDELDNIRKGRKAAKAYDPGSDAKLFSAIS
ncbi:MAG TPA: flagellar export chaperone FlgN [Planctomycetota bacterium]|nr:flagellar export chaperone FlgN [Planctomycetota bacterium]